MSWLRTEGRMPHHRKVAPLTDAAWRLHVTAMHWCVEEESDGAVPTNIPQTLPAAPRGKALTRVLDELVAADLWERTEEGFLIHDFLEYNPSAAQCEARRQSAAVAGAKGGKAKASGGHTKKVALGQQDAKPEPSEPLATRLADPYQRASGISDSDSETRREIPLPPSDRTPPRDPFGDSLRGRRAQDDPGVIALFEAWKLAHGSTGSKFREPGDPRADALHEAVKTHGVDVCLRVLEASKTDGMVTGRDDERGQEHRSVEYLFKPTTFDRLLRAAELAARPKPGIMGNGVGPLERAMTAVIPPEDLAEVYDPSRYARTQ